MADSTSASKSMARDFAFLPIPRRLRYDPERPVDFGIALNILFGFSATFIVANLYYCQPILVHLSTGFNVGYDEVSNIPTLIQGGYACGILFISPLGDLVRRRPLLILLVFLAGSLSIGLATTNSLVGFEVLSFFVGMFSVVPQILIPLAADLAPPKKRAFAISVVISGLVLGLLVARVLAGIIANFASWRVVYYMAIGVQFFVLFLLYTLLPDYPAKNTNLTYLRILGTMAKFAVTEPILIQACIINLCASACFSNFWVTLTFLLSEAPYNYSTLVVGLFGLIGIAGVANSPFIGRVVDKLVPWYGSLISITLLIIFQAIQAGAGGVNVGAVIVSAFGSEAFRQMNTVSLTTKVYSIEPSARARLNSVLLLFFFVGQIMGTSAGTKVFVLYGWRAAAGLSLGWMGVMLIVLFSRGPHAGRYTWFGWEGGWTALRSTVEVREAKRADEEKAVASEQHSARTSHDMDGPTPVHSSPAVSVHNEKGAKGEVEV